jgi:hypothetical protein
MAAILLLFMAEDEERKDRVGGVVFNKMLVVLSFVKIRQLVQKFNSNNRFARVLHRLCYRCSGVRTQRAE